ncbi:MAG: ATP synthase F1 subunit epsilon [Spirochaetota bacterium]|nr:ATP synthase F1 subunit epsilon [Spirochaetota bacterium]
MERKIECSIVTPDKIIFEGQAEYAVVQAFDGEMGFLYNHAPLISELGIGEIRLRNNSDIQYLVVEGGFVEIRDNVLNVLADNAYIKKDLSKEQIEQDIKELKQTSISETDLKKMNFEVELTKLKARLKVASR